MTSPRTIFLNASLALAIALALGVGCKSTTAKTTTYIATKPAPEPEPAAKQPKQSSLTAREAFDLAVEAYIYGYPLVTMDMTRRLSTNVQEPQGMRAPLGQFARARIYPMALNRDVTVPNVDSLYTMLWLDVAREPWVLSLPDAKDRYCLFPLLDGWTTVFGVLGKRTTGTATQQCVITGPGWKGKLPRGLREYKSPTGIVWVPGRVFCTGTQEDYAAAHDFQDHCSAAPLSSYGKPYPHPPGQLDPALNMKKSAREQVHSLVVGNYFTRLALLLKDNPPAHDDARLLKRMARLGIVPGQPFDISLLDPMIVQVLQDVPTTAVARIIAHFKDQTKPGPWNRQNGWSWTLKTGAYGTDYMQRALVALVGLGANLPQDALVAISSTDTNGQPYSGNFRYQLRFPPGQAPAANGFWSLTLYGSDYFFVDNALGRYSLSARDQLKFNADGSLDIFIQHFPPGADRESNWLPAPEDKFILVLRYYWPNETLLKGPWTLPGAKRWD